MFEKFGLFGCTHPRFEAPNLLGSPELDQTLDHLLKYILELSRICTNKKNRYSHAKFYLYNQECLYQSFDEFEPSG